MREWSERRCDRGKISQKINCAAQRTLAKTLETHSEYFERIAAAGLAVPSAHLTLHRAWSHSFTVLCRQIPGTQQLGAHLILFPSWTNPPKSNNLGLSPIDRARGACEGQPSWIWQIPYSRVPLHTALGSFSFTWTDQAIVWTRRGYTTTTRATVLPRVRRRVPQGIPRQSNCRRDQGSRSFRWQNLDRSTSKLGKGGRIRVFQLVRSAQACSWRTQCIVSWRDWEYNVEAKMIQLLDLRFWIDCERLDFWRREGFWRGLRDTDLDCHREFILENIMTSHRRKPRKWSDYTATWRLRQRRKPIPPFQGIMAGLRSGEAATILSFGIGGRRSSRLRYVYHPFFFVCTIINCTYWTGNSVIE